MSLFGGVAVFGIHQRAVAVEAAQRTPDHSGWSDYSGGADSAQYSALRQIDRSNVGQLKQAWFYRSTGNRFRFGFNPLVVGGVMYLLGSNDNIVALGAATGREIWVHDTGKPRIITHRGFNYWQSKDGSDRRLLFASDNVLHAVDARTGETIHSFGKDGGVDLREGLGRDPKTIRQIQSGTPGRVFENLLLIGSTTGEEYESPPGDLRAYDVVTGRLVWTFHTVPHPGEPGYETWPPEAWKYIGGTNTWGEISVDEKRGIAYFPIGSPTYDFYGGDRVGANLYSDCLLALDARTGKHLWHFQTVHHDLWDYDLETGPKLLRIRHDGKMLDVVAQPSKNGFLYVFDRVSGKPVWPIVERDVPTSDVPGEKAWPTQPFPSAPPPFARQRFTADDINPYVKDPAERETIKGTILAARNEGLFTPPGTRNTLETPGNNGGSNWGTAAADPTSGMLYVQSKDAPSMLKLEPKPPRRQMTGAPEVVGHIVYLQNCQQCHTPELKGQPPAVPSLVDVVVRLGADRVRETVHNGQSPMPAFPELDTDDLNHLVAFLAAPEKGVVPPDVMARIAAPEISAPKLGPGGVRYWTGYGYMNTSTGLPAIAPPWSTLTAYDLNKGTIVWKIALGGINSLADKGVKGTGSFWPFGGIVATAGGLIFSPTQSDSSFRAYDRETGAVLWETVIPGGGPEGIPAVYEVDGREYVVVTARAGTEPAAAGQRRGEAGDTSAQGYYVYALPDARK